MTPRLRLVAPLAAASLVAGSLLLAPTAAHADARTLRLVSTAAPQDADYAGVGGGVAFYSSGGDLYRDGAATPVATGVQVVRQVSTDGSRVLVTTAEGLERIDVASGAPNLIAPGAVTFVATDPDLTEVVYVQGGQVLRGDGTDTPVVVNDGSGAVEKVLASTFLDEVYVQRDGFVYRGGQLVGDGSLLALSGSGAIGYLDSADGLVRFVGSSTTIQPEGYVFVGQSLDGHVAYLEDGTGLHRSVDGGAPAFVTAGAFAGVAPDGALLWTDGDGLHRTTVGGVTTLVSGGVSGNVFYGAATTDRVFFTGYDQAEAATAYVYESGAVTTLATGAFAGTDGSRAWVESDEALTAADTDALRDVYVSALALVVPPTEPPTLPPTPSTDTTPPAASLDGKKKQVLDMALEVTVTCGTAEPCQVTGAGKLKVSVPAARGRATFKLKAKGATISAGAERVIAFKVPAKARATARKALQRGGSAKAKLKVTVTDAAGNERVIAFRVVAFRVIAFRQGQLWD